MRRRSRPSEYGRPYTDGMHGPYFHGGIPNLPAVRFMRWVLVLAAVMVIVVLIAVGA